MKLSRAGILTWARRGVVWVASRGRPARFGMVSCGRRVCAKRPGRSWDLRRGVGWPESLLEKDVALGMVTWKERAATKLVSYFLVLSLGVNYAGLGHSSRRITDVVRSWRVLKVGRKATRRWFFGLELGIDWCRSLLEEDQRGSVSWGISKGGCKASEIFGLAAGLASLDSFLRRINEVW